jgi:2-polyprenyl-6-hydroxyphenyl methylase/3-demethylubiquinone-9 3-methyltransferase
MMLSVLHNNIFEYHGVDFSEEMIASAENRSKQLEFTNRKFYVQDIVEFAKEHKQQFDVAFAMDFSEHVCDKDWVGILKAIRSSLKLGGKLYMHTPNAEYAIEILKDIGVLKQFPEHIAVRDANENVALLKQANFIDIEVVFLPHYELRQQWVHWFSFLPVIGGYFQARLFIKASSYIKPTS